MSDCKDYTLFGGDSGWSACDWTASDDRVRGGKSQSYLDICDDIARFHGQLDIKTLGGAGFASQRTTGDDREWDLSKYAGIQISVAEGDKKRYTFNLKDELLPKDPETGREQSSISYECDFELPPQAEPGHTYDRNVFIPWSAFTPSYRGKPKKDAKPIDLEKIKRLSIMMRSFFGTQEGEFSLSIRSIVALAEVPLPDEHNTLPVDHAALEKGFGIPQSTSTLRSDLTGCWKRLIHEKSVAHHGGRGRIATLVLGTLTVLALLLYSGRHWNFCGHE